MQVAEKRQAVESEVAAVSSAVQPEECGAKQAQGNGVLKLIERQEAYTATDDGTPVHLPALSAEASQPTPFLSLTWEQWQEMRAQITRGLERFVSAVEEQRADRVLSIGMEMQAAISRIFLEAYAMSADLGLQELPH